jgi:hypothetical protein
MQSRSAAWIAVVASAGCFGDPPTVGGDTDTTVVSTSAVNDDSGQTTPATTSESGEVSSDGGSSSETGDTDTSASTTGVSAWCLDPMQEAFPPHAPDDCPTMFEGVARLGGDIWIAGAHASSCASPHPAAWRVDPSGTIDLPVDYQLGQTFSLAAFLDATNGPPLAIYNEVMVRSVVLDDPTDGAYTQVGAWDPTAAWDAFGDVARLNDGTLIAAATTNDGGPTFWKVVSSSDGGMTWPDTGFQYTMSGAQPATANAIAVNNDGLMAVAGSAVSEVGIPHWVAFAFEIGSEPGEPDILVDANAHAALIVGDDVIIGGEIGNAGTIRHARGPDGAFETLGAFTMPVRDLAVAPGGVLVALTGFESIGFSVSVCADPALGPACWREIGGAIPPASHLLFAYSVLVEPDAVWVAGSLHDGMGGPPHGLLYRIDCSS